MIIAGIEKLSTIDYPNTVSTVLFVGGCNLRCHYCHNSSLIDFTGIPLDVDETLEFLEKRKKYIDAVCISGGEPCNQKDLPEFAARLKQKGFKLKMDTNGTNPLMLSTLIDAGLVDYVAMDVKAPFELYYEVTGVMVDVNAVKKSIDILLASDLECEFRTTVCRPLLNPEDIIGIAGLIKGAKRYYIQQFKDNKNILCGQNILVPFDNKELEEIKNQIKDWFGVCEIRT